MFRIYLPPTDEPLAAPAPSEAHVAAPSGRETILLVEDEPQVRELTADVLRSQGYVVLTAADGAQGLAIGRANAGRIDLLLSDLVMPSLGGRELAAMLQEEQPALACLLMSGYTPEPSAIAQLDRSRQAFIAKPFTLTELARRVREVLDRRPA
jgi:DNA-binding response OmpR family regulator